MEESDKSHWFLRGLGIQFSGFADTRMVFLPILAFRDLLHQAIQFDMTHCSLKGAPSPLADFSAMRDGRSNSGKSQGTSGYTSNRGSSNRGSQQSEHTFSDHPGGGDNSNNGGGNNTGGGGCRPYIPRCQICLGEHYVDKCPSFSVLGMLSRLQIWVKPSTHHAMSRILLYIGIWILEPRLT